MRDGGGLAERTRLSLAILLGTAVVFLALLAAVLGLAFWRCGVKKSRDTVLLITRQKNPIAEKKLTKGLR
jgi:hypothetical protein